MSPWQKPVADGKVHRTCPGCGSSIAFEPKLPITHCPLCGRKVPK